MSDERRQTRLLPFRLRRGAGGRGTATARPTDSHEDAELRELLRAWEAPAPSHAARGRMLEAFRRQARAEPLWRRLLTTRVNVPLPLAACAVVALSLLAALIALRPPHVSLEAPANGVPELRVVEVPGPERVVERVVYAGPKVGRGSRRDAEPSARRARVPVRAPERGEEETANYFTRVNMAEFQPAGDMTIRVVRKGEGR